MTARIPEEIMQAARSLYRSLGITHQDQKDYCAAILLIACRLMDRDQRAAEIARRMLMFADTTSAADEDIPQAILSYDEAQQ